MLYKKKVTTEVRPQTIAQVPVQPVQPVQPVVERDVVVERNGWSSEAIAAMSIAGIILLGLMFYFLWYRPANDPSVVVTQPGVVERNTVVEKPVPSTTVTTPPVVVQPPATTPPPVIVNPPANSTPDVNIVTPPVHVEGSTSAPESSNNSTTSEPPGTDAPPVVPGDGGQ